MKSNYITIHPMNGSRPFTIYFEGFFSYEQIFDTYNLTDYILINSSTIDVVTEKYGYLMWVKYLDQYYQYSQYSTKLISEEEFFQLYKPLEYKAQFEELLS